MGEREYLLKLERTEGQGITVAGLSEKPMSIKLRDANSSKVELVVEGELLSFRRPGSAEKGARVEAPTISLPKDVLASPLPGRVISLMVSKGDEVEPGDPLVVIESMKMETAVRSDRDCIVEDLLVSEGATVKRGQGLVKLRAKPRV
jgi:biotin carboxyl carrier protein